MFARLFTTLMLLGATFIGLANIVHAANVLEGKVTKVRDVDTIEVQGVAVRLNGVDGPELNTRIGKEGKFYLTRILKGASVRCELNGDRTHDRVVGVCYLNGQDLGAIVISEGLALDCRRYSGGHYRHLETAAAKSAIRRARYCK